MSASWEPSSGMRMNIKPRNLFDETRKHQIHQMFSLKLMHVDMGYSFLHHT